MQDYPQLSIWTKVHFMCLLVYSAGFGPAHPDTSQSCRSRSESYGPERSESGLSGSPRLRDVLKVSLFEKWPLGFLVVLVDYRACSRPFFWKSHPWYFQYRILVPGSCHAPKCSTSLFRVNKFRAVLCHKPLCARVRAMSRPS